MVTVVAILLSVKEAVEDLEQSEIRTMLHRLPLLNMEMVSDPCCPSCQ